MAEAIGSDPMSGLIFQTFQVSGVICGVNRGWGYQGEGEQLVGRV
jgi:hypothetical protein